MNQSHILWNHISAKLPQPGSREIIAYYSYPYKGMRVSRYGTCTYDGKWHFRHALPDNARIHSWQYLDLWQNEKRTKQSGHRKCHTGRIQVWLSDDARHWRESCTKCFSDLKEVTNR